MLRRIDPQEALAERVSPASGARESERIALPPLEADGDLGLLPRGHPQWVRDGVSISRRARDVLARLRPIAVRVLHFWDHSVRSMLVAGRRVSVDPSGSYRVD